MTFGSYTIELVLRFCCKKNIKKVFYEIATMLSFCMQVFKFPKNCKIFSLSFVRTKTPFEIQKSTGSNIFFVLYQYICLTSGLYDLLIRKVGISFSIPGTNFQTVSRLRLQSLDGRSISLHSPNIFQLENSVAGLFFKNLDVE